MQEKIIPNYDNISAGDTTKIPLSLFKIDPYQDARLVTSFTVPFSKMHVNNWLSTKETRFSKPREYQWTKLGDYKKPYS